MSRVTVSVLYGMGGHDEGLPHNNVVETVTIEQAGDSWVVRKCDGAGTELDSRPATDDEVQRATQPAAESTNTTPAAPVSVVTDQQKQIDGLKAVLQALLETLPAANRKAVEATLAASGS